MKPNATLSNLRRPIVTIEAWLKQATALLKQSGVESARLDAMLILSYVLKVDKAKLLAGLSEPIPEQAVAHLNALLARREKRQPLAYVTGVKEFYGFPFRVSRAVLVPRPETEALVSCLIEEAPTGARVIDVGTGCGAIAIASKLTRSDLDVEAVDVSTDALKLARQNAALLGAKVKFYKSDLLGATSGKYSVVVANLPYLKSDHELAAELAYEPKEALLSGSDGLDHYRTLAKQLSNSLSPDGFVIIEHQPEQTAALSQMLAPVSLSRSEVTPPVSLFRESDRPSRR